MNDLISRKAAIEAALVPPEWDGMYIQDLNCRIREAIEALPSAEPQTFHVIDLITGKEADPYEIALHEEWAKNLIYCDMEGFAIEEDGSLILVDECGKQAPCPEGRFKVVWDE